MEECWLFKKSFNKRTQNPPTPISAFLHEISWVVGVLKHHAAEQISWDFFLRFYSFLNILSAQWLTSCQTDSFSIPFIHIKWFGICNQMVKCWFLNNDIVVSEHIYCKPIVSHLSLVRVGGGGYWIILVLCNTFLDFITR